MTSSTSENGMVFYKIKYHGQGVAVIELSNNKNDETVTVYCIGRE